MYINICTNGSIKDANVLIDIKRYCMSLCIVFVSVER